METEIICTLGRLGGAGQRLLGSHSPFKAMALDPVQVFNLPLFMNLRGILSGTGVF